MLRLIATPVIGRIATRYTTRTSARMAEWLIYADQSLATNDRIDHALRIAGQPDTGAVFHETARLVCSFRGVRPEWRDELMADVSTHPRPTLIVWGDRDRILPAKHLEAARRLVPHAQVSLFKGVGHMPQVESADKFAGLTLDFLRSRTVAESGSACTGADSSGPKCAGGAVH